MALSAPVSDHLNPLDFTFSWIPVLLAGAADAQGHSSGRTHIPSTLLLENSSQQCPLSSPEYGQFCKK